LPNHLFVMRHAKSSWDHPGLTDHDRPLNPRGLKDAPRMAEFLNRRKLAPTLLLSSSAKRAVTTAELLQCHLTKPPKWEVISDFYLAPPTVYLQQINLLTDTESDVLLIGHNPGLEMLVQQLAGEYHRMPTAAIAAFQMDTTDWQSLSADRQPLRLLGVWRPKEIHSTT